MREHQIVAFRAIDRPVSDKNLQYMRRQSSRAEITPRSFDNEYHYGDFRGDALEMLRRGYNIHLHYANFGIRKLLVRFPHGLPDDSLTKPYFAKGFLRFQKDKQGTAGTLHIEPFHEPGDLEDLWEIDEFIDRLVPLRAEILDGDLRPLYLAHLAMACDGEHDPEGTTEAPVPAGLEQLTTAQHSLAELYGFSDAFIAAAVRDIPPLVKQNDVRGQLMEWLTGQSSATKDGWLYQLLSDPDSTVRSDILAMFRHARGGPSWPTVRRGRTIAELRAAAAEIQQDTNRITAEKAALQRTKRLADMAADPDRTLRETESLVRQRSTKAYGQIGKLLADLRETFSGTDRSGLADQQARKLRSENPTRNLLISTLRSEGFLTK